MPPEKQLVIWPGTESTEREISPRTELGATFQHFERYLRRTGKTRHTIRNFISDLRNLAKWKGERATLSFFTHDRFKVFGIHCRNFIPSAAYLTSCE